MCLVRQKASLYWCGRVSEDTQKGSLRQINPSAASLPPARAITSRSAFTASPPRNAGSHLGVKCRIFLLRCSNKSCFGVTQKAAIDKTTIAGRFLSGEVVYADFSLTDANWDQQLQRMETEPFPVLQGSTPGCSRQRTL